MFSCSCRGCGWLHVGLGTFSVGLVPRLVLVDFLICTRIRQHLQLHGKVMINVVQEWFVVRLLPLFVCMCVCVCKDIVPLLSWKKEMYATC